MDPLKAQKFTMQKFVIFFFNTELEEIQVCAQIVHFKLDNLHN